MKRIIKSKIFKLILCIILCIGLLVGGGVLCINSYVVSTTEGRLMDAAGVADISDIDCIIVLGCLVKSDGSPSNMLEDRIKRGVEIYDLCVEKGNATKLLMSGDHGSESYNEVYAMKQYAIELDVESEAVFMDHAGFSTYESIYRAKEIFGAERIVIVSQEYHLYRALYIAEALGMEAWGVSSDLRGYSGQAKRDLREILARNKDFLTSIAKPEPTYLGDKISLDGSGDVTNDEVNSQ